MSDATSMYFNTLRADLPDIVLPTDPEYKEIAKAHLAFRAQQVKLEQTANETKPSAPITDADTLELRSIFESDDQLLLPETDPYEIAVFVGNLNYVRKAPSAVCVPSSIEQVRLAVKWAFSKNVHLTVKNGGHSYAGYCLNKGGLMLDLCRFNKVSINDAGTEVTIQGGCVWNNVYDTLKGRNLANIIVGGQCPTVGVSGFTLGGGLSPFTRSYGLGIDNVLEMTVVTADGELLTLTRNETDPERRDLFWALCGGGGGNFAILLEFKSKVHSLRDPYAKVVCGPLSWDLSAPETRSQFEAAMKVFNDTVWPNELTVDAIWRYVGGKLMGEMTTIYNGNMKQCLDVIAPLLQFNPVNKLAEMGWHDWVVIEQGFDVKSPVYHTHASFIFGQGGITPEVTKAIITLVEDSTKLLNGRGKSHVLWDMAGGVDKDVSRDATPYYWRDGVYIANFKLQWMHPTMRPDMLKFMKRVRDTLNPCSLKGNASYVNYIDGAREDWQYAYYGENYSRLQQIKERWDPTNFFHFEQSIELPGFRKIPAPIYSNAPPKSLPPVFDTITHTSPVVFESDTTDIEPVVEVPDKESAAPEVTLLDQIAAIWDAFELPDPEKLWNLEDSEPSLEKVLMVLGGERVQATL
ncbi:hypothetical protein FB446DRAFT_359569 [Lentinula raphanica]|nr:hypothetical protein FB446DRAFT_359569 [Lentinula raphanica]